jgi:hypothetical protein
MLVGPRVGTRVGIRAGVGEASSAAGPTWTIDATSSIATPLTETEAEDLLTAAGVVAPSVTSLYLFGTPASGNVSDVIGGLNLVAAGTWAYQQTIPDMAIKSAKSSNAVSGTFAVSGFGNVNATSHTIFCLAHIVTASPGVEKTVFQIGLNWDDTACLEVTTAPVLRVGEGDGTRSAGSSNPTGASRYFVIRVDDTANTVDGFTDQEKIVGGTQACNGTQLLFGGDNNNSNFPATTHYALAFRVAGALTNTQIKAVLEEAGLTVPWSP